MRPWGIWDQGSNCQGVFRSAHGIEMGTFYLPDVAGLLRPLPG